MRRAIAVVILVAGACGRDDAPPPSPPPPRVADAAVPLATLVPQPRTLTSDALRGHTITAVACGSDTYAVAADGAVVLYARDGTVRATIPMAHASAVALSADGARVIVGGQAAAEIHDAHTGALVLALAPIDGPVRDALELPDGRIAIASSSLLIFTGAARAVVALPELAAGATTWPERVSLSADRAALIVTAESPDVAAFAYALPAFAGPRRVGPGTPLLSDLGPDRTWIVTTSNGWAKLARYPSMGIIEPMIRTPNEAETGGSIATPCPDDHALAGYAEGTAIVWPVPRAM